MLWLPFVLAQDPNYFQYLGTLRPYPHPSQFHAPLAGECSLEQVHVISRHGERTPSSTNLKSMQSAAKKLMRYADYEVQLPFNEETSGNLTQLGIDTLYEIGVRARHKYHLLADPSKMLIHTSDMERCAASSYHFLRGLLGNEVVAHELQRNSKVISPTKSDSDLNPFLSCRKHFERIDYSIDEDVFLMKLLDEARDKVELSIGYTDKMSNSVLGQVYEMCGFLTAVDRTQVPEICSRIPITAFKAICTYHDLMDWKKYGYGRKINADMQSSIMLGTWRHMNKKIQNKEDAKSMIVRFAHTETLMPLVTAFGIFYDQHPTWDEHRLWQTQFFGSFSNNIVIELYQCSAQYKVRLLVNEVPIKMPRCADMLCTLEEFFGSYALQDFDFDKMCGNTRPSFGSWNTDM